MRDVVLIVLVAVVLSFFAKTFLIRSFYIPSGSMESTLQISDRIIVNELVPGIIPVERGDVVVFTDPGGWLDPVRPIAVNPVQRFLGTVGSAIGLSAADSNDHLIKRVIGLPGDEVACCDDLGRLVVNGQPLTEPYVTLGGTSTAASQIAFDVTVPADSLWVMGDNRDNSKDSRYNTATPSRGFVPYNDLVGRAVVVTWPVSRWTWLDNYTDVFIDVQKRTT